MKYVILHYKLFFIPYLNKLTNWLCVFIMSRTRLEWIYILRLPEWHELLARNRRDVAKFWPDWLNGWVFVYELSCCGFEFRCQSLNWSSLNFKLSNQKYPRRLVREKGQYFDDSWFLQWIFPKGIPDLRVWYLWEIWV